MNIPIEFLGYGVLPLKLSLYADRKQPYPRNITECEWGVSKLRSSNLEAEARNGLQWEAVGIPTGSEKLCDYF